MEIVGGDGLSTMEFVADTRIPVGNHAYWLLAYDQGGNGNTSEIIYLHVMETGIAPEIKVSYIIDPRPEGHPNRHIMEPCACDKITFRVSVEGEDLSDVDHIDFEYDGHYLEINPSIPPGVEQFEAFLVEDYPIPLGASSIYYRAHVSDTEGFYDFTSETLELNTCTNSIQDAGESGIDCGGICPSECRYCLHDFSYPGYSLDIDCCERTHFNFPHDGELELARGISHNALREYANDNPGIWLSQLDTADEYMEAIAHYVYKHMSYMTDDNTSSAYFGAQTFWYTATQSATRGCGNDYCGDCEDFAIMRMTLLLALGVSDNCVFMLHGPDHFYNLVYYQGKFRIMDYGELGTHFINRTTSRQTDKVAMTSGFSTYLDHIYNYPGPEWCTWRLPHETVYCDFCP